MSVGRRLALMINDPQDFLPAFEPTLDMLREQLPAESLPTVAQFFPTSVTEPNTIQHLSRKLLRGLQEGIRQHLDQVAPDRERFFLTVTSHETCGDFLFAPLTDGFNRMYRAFRVYTRLYLGLPVTASLCNINECNRDTKR